jgi:hypothetical protein
MRLHSYVLLLLLLLLLPSSHASALHAASGIHHQTMLLRRLLQRWMRHQPSSPHSGSRDCPSSCQGRHG